MRKQHEIMPYRVRISPVEIKCIQSMLRKKEDLDNLGIRYVNHCNYKT